METIEYIFPVVEIEYIIFTHLDILAFYNLFLVNKYYNESIQNHPTFLEFHNFYLTKNDLELNILTFEDEDYDTKQFEFLKACHFGFSHVCKYLYYRYQSKINIHYLQNYVFRHSCLNGHFQVIEWLLQLDSDVVHTIPLSVIEKSNPNIIELITHVKWRIMHNQLGTIINSLQPGIEFIEFK